MEFTKETECLKQNRRIQSQDLKEPNTYQQTLTRDVSPPTSPSQQSTEATLGLITPIYR